MFSPSPHYLLCLGSLRNKINLSKLQEGRNWKIGFLGPALTGSRLSESGKVDEVKAPPLSLLYLARSLHVWAAFLVIMFFHIF